jgi:hypothetical protein
MYEGGNLQKEQYVCAVCGFNMGVNAPIDVYLRLCISQEREDEI